MSGKKREEDEQKREEEEEDQEEEKEEQKNKKVEEKEEENKEEEGEETMVKSTTLLGTSSLRQMEDFKRCHEDLPKNWQVISDNTRGHNMPLSLKFPINVLCKRQWLQKDTSQNYNTVGPTSFPLQ